MSVTASDAILLMNSVTFIVTLTASIKRPILSYKIIAAVAFCAEGSALYHLITGKGDTVVLVSTVVLVLTMTWRIGLNFRRPAKRPGSLPADYSGSRQVQKR